MLDRVADVLVRASGEAILGTARQKLFASIIRLRDGADRDPAVRQLHLARFLMADQTNLISSANWLLRVGEPELARDFALEAERFGSDSPSLANVLERIDIAIADRGTTDRAQLSREIGPSA